MPGLGVVDFTQNILPSGSCDAIYGIVVEDIQISYPELSNLIITMRHTIRKAGF